MEIANSKSTESGYASLSVLILVMALSIMIAAGLGLSQQILHQAQSSYKTAQSDEALNEALMRFGVEALQSPEREFINSNYTINNQSISITGENEALKWPVKDSIKLTPILLSDRTARVSFEDIRNLIRNVSLTSSAPRDMPMNDCFRRLFSTYGQAEFKPRLPSAGGLSAGLASKDGQIWRLRAILGNRVRESWVRFTGGTDRLYALISEQDQTLSREPSCIF